uniref:Uncharacterized protein n=1 Tax=Oncorhynchus mykiss TaxID=8022 RepID=A0A8K9V2W5_ONCMY
IQRETTLKKRDDYEDILEERRNSSDLKYAHRFFTRDSLPATQTCSRISSILISYVSQESGEAPDISQEESCVILEEMAYRLQISTVHFFAFTLSKDFKTFLQHLQQAIQEHPMVLLPSHCSYMDFPLMSYNLYTYDLALPVIIGAGSMGAEGAAAPLEKSEYKINIYCTSQKFGYTDSFKGCSYFFLYYFPHCVE